MRTSLAVCVSLAAGLLACGNAAPVGHKTLRPTFDWSSSSDLIPGQILVDLKDDVSDSDIRDIESKYGVVLTEANEVAHQYRYEEAAVPTDEEFILNELQADSRVEHAEPMIRVQALGYVPNDPMYNEQWGLTRVGTESSWGMSCGQGARVAIIDTGVQCYADDGISDLNRCTGGYDFVRNSEGEARDENGHGSHCASTVAEITNNGIGGAGIAPCATIVPVRVLDANGSGSMEGVAMGIRWAADHADVLSMSLGAHQPSDVVKDAVDYAYSKGKIIVAANGNSGGSIGWPAAYDHVIAVSAIDKNDKIADFSSRGPQTAIAAPGVDILQSTYLDGQEVYRKFSGTSMSTPHVSGVAALLVSQGITNPDAVREKLQSTADPKKDPKLYGAGILRADAAVRSAITSHLITRLIALFGVILLLGAAVKGQWKNLYSLGGIVVGAFGAFPLFFTGLLPKLGAFRFIGEVLARPIGEMDMVIGSGIHSTLLFASAIPVVLVSLLTMQHPKLKLLAAGLGMGTMALEAQMAWSNDTRFMFGSLVMRVFMVVNMLICGYFVRVSS